MKKLLALVLAMAMTLGLATVGASAASYADAADIDYAEAVDVMSALEVFDGMDGKFNPDGTLTREQGAKIIAYMLLGKKAADSLTTAKSSFTDVAADRWSAGSIEYCVSENIIGGRGDGTFDPAGELTGHAFAKMCLVALGYKADLEGYGGADWAINVAKDAINAGLNEDLNLVMSQGISRQEACQMALNTLKGTLVSYTNGVNVKSGDGTEVTVNANRSNVLAGNVDYTTNTDTGDATTQFVERYFPKVRLTKATDDFGRPSDVWYDNKGNTTIGKYADEPTLTYTKGVKGGALYTDLGSTTLTTNEWDIKWCTDGVDTYATSGVANIISGNTATLGGTGNGVKTEVFFSKGDKTLTVVETQTYLAKVISGYNSSNGEAKIQVSAAKAGLPTSIKASDFALAESLKTGDYVFLNLYAANSTAAYSISAATALTSANVLQAAKVTSYKAGTWVVAGGTQYDIAKDSSSTGADLMNGGWSTTSGSYDLILDNYGYVMAAQEHDAATTTYENYLFVTGATSDALGTRASVTFMDGTTKTIDVAKYYKNAADTTDNVKGLTVQSPDDGDAASDTIFLQNVFYKYSVNSKGDYTLTYEATAYNVGTAQFKKGDANVLSGLAANNTYNSDTVTTIINSKTVLVEKDVSYTGVANFPSDSATHAFTYWMGDATNGVKAIYTTDKQAKAQGLSEYVWLISGTDAADADGSYTLYTAVKEDGTIDSNVKVDTTAKTLNGLYQVAYSTSRTDALDVSADNYVAGTQAATAYAISDVDGYAVCRNVDMADTWKVSGGVLTMGSSSYTLSDDVTFYVIDPSANSRKVDVYSYDGQSVIDAMSSGNYQVFLIRKNANSTSDLTYAKVFIVKGAGV